MNRNGLIQHMIAAWHLDGSGTIESRMGKAMDVVLEEAGKVADEYATDEYMDTGTSIAEDIRTLKHSPSIPAQYERAGEARKAGSVLTEEEILLIAANRVIAIRGSSDVPAYNVCVDAEANEIRAALSATPSPATGERDAVMEEGRELIENIDSYIEHHEMSGMQEQLMQTIRNFIERHIGRTG